MSEAVRTGATGAPRPVPAAEPAAPGISVVVPVVGIHDAPGEIHRALEPHLRATGRTYEFVFVVDADDRDSARAAAELRRREANVAAWQVGRRLGESAALAVGFRRARGRVVLTVGPYLQAEPAEIPRLLEALEAGADLVVTRRSPRTDSLFNRLQSRVFHAAVSTVTGTRFGDISCGLRAMRAEVARSLRLYGDQHRFIPLLAVRDGFRVVELPVRQSGTGKRLRVFGPATYLSRVLDVLTVFFLVRFTKRPLRFFGTLGAAIFAAGFALCLYLTWVKFAYSVALMERPLLLLGVLLLVLGIQTASIGLLGEIVIFTQGQEERDYRAEEIPR